MAARTRVGPAFAKRERDIDKWMKMMEKWGTQVRANIVHIEKQLEECCEGYEPYRRKPLPRFQDKDGNQIDPETVYNKKT